MNKKIFFALAAFLIAALVPAFAGGGKDKGGKVAGGSWNFSDPALGTQGWYLANNEFYEYHGTTELSYDDKTFGKGLLRLDVDFTKDVGSEWSEPKMKNEFAQAYNMKGKTKFCFDFYWNPSLSPAGGNFKSKVLSNSNGVHVDSSGDAIEDGEDVGNGFKKAQVEILIMPTSGSMKDMLFSIAGYHTDYKGPVFFDNMRFE
jgi:mannan endo-1,4-beta-mannosidase